MISEEFPPAIPERQRGGMDAPGRMLRASHRNRSRGDGWFLLLFFVYKMVKFDASEIVESLVNKSSLFRVENHVN